MKSMQKFLKSSLLILMVIVTVFSLSLLSGAASDKYNTVFTIENNGIDEGETISNTFTLEYDSILKIEMEGNSDLDCMIEIKDSNGATVFSDQCELWLDDYVNTTNNIPKGDYTFIVYPIDGDIYYCDISLSAKIDQIIPAESITLNESKLYMCKSDKSTLKYELAPAEANVKVTWTSSDKSVATVSSSGTVKGIAPGKATITATAGDKTATCKVTVFSTSGKSYKTIVSTQIGTLNPGESKKNKFTLNTYSKVKISFTGLDFDLDKGTYGLYEINIKNSDGDIVYTVKSDSGYDDKSHTTPVLPKGTYTFILKTYGDEDSYYTDDLDYYYKISYMAVSDVKIKKVKLSSTSVSLEKGKSKTLTATPDPSYASNKVEWTTSNKKVATVSSKGKVTAKALGAATITAKIGSKKATCKVKVTSMSATVIKKRTLKLSSYIKNISSYKNATWSSSNTAIATVDKTGKVSGKANGSCNIYCTIKGTKYTFKITVKPALTAKPSYVSDVDIYNDAGIKFTNNTNLDITYVTLNIYQYDNRGYRLSSPYSYYYVNDTIYAKSSETYEFWVNDSTKKFTCSVTKVWFSDGSTWTP